MKPKLVKFSSANGLYGVLVGRGGSIKGDIFASLDGVGESFYKQNQVIKHCQGTETQARAVLARLEAGPLDYEIVD